MTCAVNILAADIMPTYIVLCFNCLIFCGEPRGFSFVQYAEPHAAAEVKYHMDGQVLLGQELTVVFAEENRKKPTEMRARDQGRGRFRDQRRSPPRYSHAPQYSHSPPPRHARSMSWGHDYYSPPPKRRHYSRSLSPQEGRYNQERTFSQSRSCSQSPNCGQSRGPSRSRSRSRRPRRYGSQSPDRDEYPQEASGDGSPSQ